MIAMEEEEEMDVVLVLEAVDGTICRWSVCTDTGFFTDNVLNPTLSARRLELVLDVVLVLTPALAAKGKPLRMLMLLL